MFQREKSLWFCLTAVFALAITLAGNGKIALAQTDRGVITGTVTDTSGAAIPSVAVVAIQKSTGVQFQTVTSGYGFYSLLDLPIGSYDVNFRRDGFKDLDQRNIIVETQHTIRVDAKLAVGSVMETVTVTTAQPVLEIQTEVGTNMNAQEMTDLPLSVNGGRDMTAFAFAVTPNVNGSEWASSIGNSQNFTKSVLIDGTSVDSGVVGHVQESEPSMDAIDEAQVDTAGLRAEDGRTGGGAFLYELKSGTNVFHGSGFGFLGNEFLNANTWDNKWYLSQCASGDTTCENQYKRARDRYSDYGFSGGGPVWRKWLGLKKMYVFGAYEKYLQSDFRESPNQATVPTAKMLNGDFSELLSEASTVQGNWPDGTPMCTSAPCPILQSENGPAFTDSVGNTIYYGSIFSPSGNAYPGNIITDPISSRAKSLISLYQKDYQPTGPGVLNNYPSLVNGFPWFHQSQLSFKYDWEVTPNDKVAVSYIYTLRPRIAVSGLWEAGSSDGGPLTDSNEQVTVANAYRGNETHVFNPNLLNTISYTFNAFQNKRVPSETSAGPGTMGLGNIDHLGGLPLIGLNGGPNGVWEAWPGWQAQYGYVAYNAILNDTLSWTKARHTMKFGLEYRALGFNYDSTGGSLAYYFSNTTFAPTAWQIQGYVGSSLANLMLGYPINASQGVTFDQDSRRKEVALFAQDDIKINKRFTVSADLRWELTGPLHALNGEWSNYDINAPNPLFNNIPGAYTWLAHPSDSFETYADWHQFGPKLGGSYQINDKMVVRASAGINFVPLGWNQFYAVPYGAAAGFTGIDQVAEIAPQTPAFQWDASAYPGVYTPGAGKVNTPALQQVWGPANIDPHTRQLGFTQNWFAGLQYALPGNAKVELSYMGNSGKNLHDGAINPLNYPQWSTYQPLLQSGNAEAWVSDAASAAAAGVPYPYPGFAGEAYQAINPFPQVQSNTYGGVYFTSSPLGRTGYNAVTVEGMKQRGSLNLDLSYNWSRSTGNTGTALIEQWSFNYWWQNPYDYKHEATYPSTYDQVKGYLTYALPLGQGRRFLSGSRVLNYLVGGWVMGTTVWYGNGGLFGAVGSSNYYPGWSADYANVTPNASFKNMFKRWNPAWNPSAAGAGSDPESLYFNPNNFSNPTYGQLGNSPTLFSNWRGWSEPQENGSLLKKTRFGADNRYVVTLRAEFFDLFNRHYWYGPNTNIASPFFGHVTGVSGNRTGQLGARFEW